VPPAYDNVPRWEKPFIMQDLVSVLPAIVRKR
jgi:hypothetical protein